MKPKKTRLETAKPTRRADEPALEFDRIVIGVPPGDAAAVATSVLELLSLKDLRWSYEVFWVPGPDSVQ